MKYFNNHIRLFTSALFLFLFLTLMVAVIPALENQANNGPLPMAVPLSGEAVRGKGLFIANGCVGCHTQQVRSVDMDRIWGERPGVAADYADNMRISLLINTATLMGTERTGPDLTNIGNRQPSRDWHLLHLYNPRAVVPQSIMPSYPWLFEVKNHLGHGQVEITVPEQFRTGVVGKIVATRDALDLFAYLASLKQVSLLGKPAPEFLYAKKGDFQSKIDVGAQGRLLYTSNCQSCHQSSGEGLKGAFPPLKGSKIVLDEDLEPYIDIIMNGYDAREEYGVMPAVGTSMKFTEKELTALINHERSNWGNQGKKVTEAEVKKILDIVNKKTAK